MVSSASENRDKTADNAAGERVQHAFPSGDGKFAGWPSHDYGMTLRDWFAGQAMAGISANPELAHEPYSEIAEWSYKQADEMLAARAPAVMPDKSDNSTVADESK